jgi:hypothetical protein
MPPGHLFVIDVASTLTTTRNIKCQYVKNVPIFLIFLEVKNIGKPCAGKPHARFDEGGLVNCPALHFRVVACDKMS